VVTLRCVAVAIKDPTPPWQIRCMQHARRSTAGEVKSKCVPR
jgi:hypothetical protein